MTLSSRRGGTGHSSATRRAEQWFDRILVHHRDRLRRTKRVPFGDLPSDLTTPGADPIGQVDQRDEMGFALAGLSPDHRVVVALRYYRDLPIDGAGGNARRFCGTVSSRLHYALRHLRSLLTMRMPHRGSEPMNDYQLEQRARGSARRSGQPRPLGNTMPRYTRSLRLDRRSSGLAASWSSSQRPCSCERWRPPRSPSAQEWSSFRGPATWNRQHRLCRRPPPARRRISVHVLGQARPWTVARADTSPLLLDGTLLAAGGHAGRPVPLTTVGGALRPAKRCLDSNGKHGRPASRARRHAAAGRNGPGNGRSGQQRPTPGVGGAVRPRHWDMVLDRRHDRVTHRTHGHAVG